jgi:hypothetical protein
MKSVVNTLLPRARRKNWRHIWLKYSRGASMTQSPNDTSKALHPGIHAAFGKKKYALTDLQPEGNQWEILRADMEKDLTPANFTPQWKAIINAHVIIPSLLTPKIIAGGFEIAGICTKEGKKRVQNGEGTDASSVDVILSKDPMYATAIDSEESRNLKAVVVPALTEIYKRTGWPLEGKTP